LYVYTNPWVTKGLTWEGLRYALTSTDGSSWMPVTWLSYLVDREIYGGAAWGYRVTNIAVHAASVVLLFLALSRISGRVWPSAWVAAVYGLHPLRTESVVWIAERKDVLCACVWMAGLLVYANYARRPGWVRFAAVLGIVVLGVASKTMFAAFPGALLLLDFWPLGRTGKTWKDFRERIWRLLAEKAILLIPCAIGALIFATIVAETHALIPRSDTGWTYAARLLDNYGFYLQKLVYPTDLSILYAIEPVRWWRAAFALALFVAALAVAVRSARKAPWFAVGWLWFVMGLVPVIGLVPFGQVWVADRYSYIPSVGLAIGAAWGVARLLERRPSAKWPAVGAAVGAVLACAAMTVLDLPRWRNSVAIFSAAVRSSPHRASYLNRGQARAVAGRKQAAIDDFTRAIEISPDYAKAYYNRGNVYADSRDFGPAIADFTRAIEIEPRYPRAHNDRGMARATIGLHRDAERDFTRAIELAPDSPTAYANRARLYLLTDRPDRAREDMRTMLARDWDVPRDLLDRLGPVFRP
jgi:tetratricopeptide (TPR) repeat protein